MQLIHLGNLGFCAENNASVFVSDLMKRFVWETTVDEAYSVHL